MMRPRLATAARKLMRVAEIEHAANCSVGCCDDMLSFMPGRPQDRAFVGNIVGAIEAYSRGAVGPVTIPRPRSTASSRSARTA